MSGVYRKSWTEIRILFRDVAGRILAVRNGSDDDIPWDLPGDKLLASAPPTAVFFRICHQVGMSSPEIAGTGVYHHGDGTHDITYRYFLCQTQMNDIPTTAYREMAWVDIQSLDEIAFAPGIVPLITAITPPTNSPR